MTLSTHSHDSASVEPLDAIMSLAGAPFICKTRLATNVHRRRVVATVTSQSGVGLIEVLIAVLVLSIAFLGIAALQALSLSTSNSAMTRSMATIYSYSMLDAMRADKFNAMAGSYNNAAISMSSCPATGSTLATYQINQWCTQFAVSVGTSASTMASINCPASGNCTIVITFDDSRAGVVNTSVGSSTQTITTVASL